MQKVKVLRKLESIQKQINEVYDLIDAEEPKLPKRKQQDLDSGICLGCDKKIAKGDREIRGCHERCYRKAYRAIERGDLTEREAIEAGLISPQRKTGRPFVDGTIAELVARKRKRR